MQIKYFVWLFSSALALNACGQSDDQPVSGLVSDLVQTNGLTLNGLTLNGLTLNGLTLNGLTLNGKSLNNISIVGTSLQNWDNSGDRLGQASLANSSLSVSSGWGARKSGSDLVGMTMPATLTDGSTFKMRIDSASGDSTGLWQYGVSLRADNGNWIPICGYNDSGAAVPSVALQGRYDNSDGDYTSDNKMFTFACTNAALGKCVEWGYRPWASDEECRGSDCTQRSLFDWHMACTRMVRADYCGDGVPHTRNGTQINIWDVLGIQNKATTSWQIEAEWTSDGAQCIRHTRWQKADVNGSLSDLDYVKQNCPKRLAVNNSRYCSDSNSDFTTRNGFYTDLDSRRLLRNESANNQ